MMIGMVKGEFLESTFQAMKKKEVNARYNLWKSV